MKCRQACERMDRCFKWLEPLPALLARIVVGWIFLESGWGKLHNLSGVTEFFTQLGIPFPQLQAPFIAALEFIGGIALLLGLATRPFSLLLTGVMAVAILTAKREDVAGLSDLFALSEFLYVVLLFWLFCAGASCISVDSWIKKRCPKS